MSRFRRIIFWLHLCCGVAAGAVIAIMSFTGVLLAFEDEMVEWAERDIRHFEPPVNNASRLGLEELLKSVSASRPEFRATRATILSDVDSAVVVQAGRETTLYVNPYTAISTEGTSPRLRAFMQSMLHWHRWLAMDGDNRSIGRAFTGACNLAFLVLAVSGIYLWWPRRWSWRSLKPSVWFVQNQSGKARDFNWHNVIGFWCAPVLIVLTLSGVVMSYRWANDLLYRAVGDEPPAQSARGRGGPEVAVPEHPSGSDLLNLDGLLAAAIAAEPEWNEISLQFDDEPKDATKLKAVDITVRKLNAFPAFASISLALDPVNGEVLSRNTFDDESAGRRARRWMRYLHTGEAFGVPGKFLAGLASLGGVFLVYTGFALSWRRFFPRKNGRQGTS